MSEVQYQKERDELIQKLEFQAQFIQSVQNENHRLNLLNSEQLERLQDIEEKNRKFLHKLESNEFEIAIVGLEKAGKSSFANALIGNYAVPSAPERCTFTSTRLVNGADRGKVQFYDKEEFNQIFRNLLAEIDYPEADKADYQTLSLDRFEDYFSQLEQKNEALYRNHVGKTDEEIKDIIKFRERLTLTGKIKEFSSDELYSDKFQAYIKGEKRNDVVDTSKPRSVKSIEIESSKLEKLPTAIIYDVPGFDSPTKIHARQTEERLKSADIIILITNVGRNPSLQGTSLNIINNNIDNDGIALKDKLFVFGNQLDTANSEEQSKGNIEILIKDVEKYKIGERKRVFAGSALKYLFDLGKANDNYIEKYPISSNIDEIRDAIIQYYETERFEILKTKINTNQRLLTDLFLSVSKSLENTGFSGSFDEESEKAKLTRTAYRDIEENLKSSLEKLKLVLKNEIYEDKFFTYKFKEDITSLSYFYPIQDDEFQSALEKNDDSLTQDIPYEKINFAIRSKVHKKFLEQFSRLIHSLTNEKSKEIEYRILNTVTEAVMGDNKNTELRKEVEKECVNLIKQITRSIAHNDDRFDYLIERFSRNVFDIMIAFPLLSQDRKGRFEIARNEFKYLDNFYQGGDGSLIQIILSQKKEEIVSSKEVSNSLRHLLDIAKTQFTATALARTPTKLAFDLLTNLLDKKGNINVDSYYDYDKLTENLSRSKTAESVINEINVDIENLRDILTKAVVPAINLELAFFNSIDKQIKLLIDAIISRGNNANVLDEFLAYVVPIIKKQEINNINDKIELHKIKLEFMEKIKQFVS